MSTQLTLADRQLSLDRFPVGQKNRSLQAWDSADEYLIQYVDEHVSLTAQSRIAIFNDAFGCLGCYFSEYAPLLVSDSFISHQGILHNHESNELPEPRLATATDELDDNLDLVLLKVPKNHALLEHQLIQLQQKVSPNTQIIAACKAVDLTKKVQQVFAKHLGECTTSLAWKKSRLLFCSIQEVKSSENPYPTKWQLDNSYFVIANHANVFSRASLDIGARQLLDHLPQNLEHKTLVDLGCGNGVLGLCVSALNPLARVIFRDESYMAVESAKQNVWTNLPEHMPNCEFEVNDCLSEMESHSVDFVLCNPPFHQQQAVTDHIAFQMFKDAHRVLKKGGTLRIVGNRHLGHHIKLKRIFGGFKTIASSPKFIILDAYK